jgi:hypothetical protein
VSGGSFALNSQVTDTLRCRLGCSSYIKTTDHVHGHGGRCGGSLPYQLWTPLGDTLRCHWVKVQVSEMAHIVIH